MAWSLEIRSAVRAAFNYRCGYCGVTEIWAGGEMELDHFRPVAHGGSDALTNLVYACASCNRFKSDYWSGDDAPDSLKLLQPGEDDLAAHIVQAANGRLEQIPDEFKGQTFRVSETRKVLSLPSNRNSL